MIIGRIAFGLIIFVGSMLWMISLIGYGEGMWNGKDIPDWLMGIGGVFFPTYVAITLCLILMHFGLL